MGILDKLSDLISRGADLAFRLTPLGQSGPVAFLSPANIQEIAESDDPKQALEDALLDEPWGALALGDRDRAVDNIAAEFAAAEPLTEISDDILTVIEEIILDELNAAGEVDADNVDDLLGSVEGGSGGLLLSIMVASALAEAKSAGQVDEWQQLVVTYIAGLGLADAIGLKVKLPVKEVLTPAFEERIREQHPAKVPDFGDTAEAFSRGDIDESFFEAMARKEGLREEFDDILKGLTVQTVSPTIGRQLAAADVVAKDVLRTEIERNGIHPDFVDVLMEQYEGFLRGRYFVRVTPEMSVTGRHSMQLAQQGEITLDDHADVLRSLGVAPEHTQGWQEYGQFLVDQPSAVPSQGQVDRAFALGILDSNQHAAQHDNVGLDLARHTWAQHVQIVEAIDGPLRDALAMGIIDEGTYRGLAASAGISQASTDHFVDGGTKAELLAEEVIDELEAFLDDPTPTEIVDELDGMLQEALAVGRIDENEFTNLAADAGITQEATDLFVTGATMAEVVEAQLSPVENLADAPVSVLQSIGVNREQELNAVGIVTLGDLAAADVTLVADALDVDEDPAQGFIDTASQTIA